MDMLHCKDASCIDISKWILKIFPGNYDSIIMCLCYVRFSVYKEEQQRLTLTILVSFMHCTEMLHCKDASSIYISKWILKIFLEIMTASSCVYAIIGFQFTKRNTNVFFF